MVRHIFIFLSVFFAIAFYDGASFAKEKQNLIPITVGDVERSKELTTKEYINFVASYYIANKKNGATDEQILNELIKLIDISPEEAEGMKELSQLGLYYKDFKDLVKKVVDEANMSILEKHPGRTDMIIDIDDTSTWKNIKNLYIGKLSLEEHWKSWKTGSYFSRTVYTSNVGAVLSSCADRKSDILMAFILFPKDNRFLVTGEEGRSRNGITVDFSGSKNVETGPLLFPMESTITLNEKKIFGYKEKVYLPFKVKLQNKDEDGFIQAKLSVKSCLEDKCEEEVLPQITYTTQRAILEASFCHSIIEEVKKVPSYQEAKVTLQEISFEKGKEGKTILVFSLKMPSLFSSNPTILIKNDDGLLFSEPFFIRESGIFYIKARLLNPEALKEDKAEITIHTAYPGGAAEFKTIAKIKEKKADNGLSVFSFSLSDFFLSFLLGMKFLVLTPVLSVFLFLLSQTLFDWKLSSDQIKDVCMGGLKIGLALYGVALAVFLLFVSFPSKGFLWGMQFDSPFFDFIFMLIFLLLALMWKKALDYKTIEKSETYFSKLYSVLKAQGIYEKSGIVTGTGIGILLLIVPMTYSYYQIFEVISRSIVLCSLGFFLGLFLPFFFLVSLKERTLTMMENERALKIMHILIPLPFVFQAAVLLLSICILSGTNVCIMAAVLVLIAASLIWKFDRFGKYISGFSLMCALAFVPFSATQENWNLKQSIDFDETELHRYVEDGKSVYVNVSESFCASCLWNRYLVVKKGAGREIKNGKFIVMRINYDHPFLKEMLPPDISRTLPMNIIFSPKYPEGKILDKSFTLTSVVRTINEALPVKKINTNPEMWLRQTKPKPAAKDTD